MDFNSVLAAIGSVGFPIVACIAIAVFFSRINDNYRQDLKELNTAHKDEIKNLSDVIQQNTLVIQRLCDKLDDLK